MLYNDVYKFMTKAVFKYFDTARGSITLFVEGDEFTLLENQTKYAEISVSGYRYNLKQGGDEGHELDIHIMCSARYANNIYDIQDVVSQFQNSIQSIIVVDDTDPDNLVDIGCLILRTDLKNAIDVIPWGIVQLNDGSVKSPVRSLQTSLNIFYQMDLVSN